MKRLKSTVMVVGGLCWLTFASALGLIVDPSTLRFEGTQGSTVRIKGTSNVHDWGVRGTTIAGSISVPTNLQARLNQPTLSGKLLVKAEVSIPVTGLKSDSPMFSPRVDARLISELLKSREHPSIRYCMNELVAHGVSSSSNVARVFESKGELVIAGVTNHITMPISIALVDENTLKLSGRTSVKMTDFGITPPATKGADLNITVGDEVEVAFEWFVVEAY